MWDYLGFGVLLLTAGWVGLMLAGEWSRAGHIHRQRLLEHALLREQLETERERRKADTHAAAPWNGLRKFVVKRKVVEGEGQCSFYLAAHDRKRLPKFLPGQYLTFQLNITGQARPVVRCYSLSDRPDPDYYRVTIKRQSAPSEVAGAASGLGSTYFHEQVAEGDILDVKAPGGHFHLDPAGAGGIVLIGGGIGITPMISMLCTLVAAQSRREIWLFYAVRQGVEHIMREVLQTAARENPNIHLIVCYSQPAASDEAGRDYQHRGRISLELLKTKLPSSNFDFYLCGPGALMEVLILGLKEWGVPETHVHFETFGPSSVRRVGAVQPVTDSAPPLCSVNFKRSGKILAWTGADTNLLDLAERHGVTIASGCRAGNCGTCTVAIQAGDVRYVQPPGSPPDPGICFACVAQPKGDLVLDA